jgi:hypothetical protein
VDLVTGAHRDDGQRGGRRQPGDAPEAGRMPSGRDPVLGLVVLGATEAVLEGLLGRAAQPR